jgi:uncharacterized protein (DUF433 family)
MRYNGEVEAQLMERIVCNPNILGGKLIVRGTRIPVQFLLELLGAGMSISKILEEYPHLEREDILAAIRYAARTIANEEVFVSSEAVPA